MTLRIGISTMPTDRAGLDEVIEAERLGVDSVWVPETCSSTRSVLWLAGDRDAAAARVPIEIGLRTNLIGPADEIRRRLREYRDCGVTTLRVNPMGDSLDERLAGLGQLIDLAADVNAESVEP